jgi:predicted NACHT family NTPase
MTTSRAENTEAFLVNEADRSNIEKYLSTIATSILNIDSTSQVSKEVIKFLDDNSNIIFDKIRMVQLESRLIHTITYCERLEQRLVSTERNLNESTNIVSFLRYKIDQLENVNGSGQRCGEKLGSFLILLLI